MITNWQDCFVSDIAAPTRNALVGGPFGSNLVSKDYVANGIPVIRGQNMGGRWISGDFAFVNEEKAKELSPNTAHPGDLVFTQRGTLGQVAIVPELPYGSYIISQSQMKLTADPNKANSLFLYYFFRSPEQQDYIIRNAVQTGVPHTNLEHLRKTPLLLPPLQEQCAIAEILGTLDDKIELNRRMNQTLESMARAVFRQWFVEGETVRDWEVMSIEQVAERVAMGPFGSSIKVDTFVEEGVPIISGQHLRSFMLQDTTYNFISLEHAERLKKANVQRGDVIFTHAGNVGNLAFIPEDSEYDRYVVSQRQFYMRCNSEFVTPTFITFYFQSPEGQHKLLANMSSVGVPSIAQPVSYLRSIQLPIPPKPILDEFEKLVSPLLKKYRANEKESRTLASLRDTLLPKLMRGEVRVKVSEG